MNYGIKDLVFSTQPQFRYGDCVEQPDSSSCGPRVLDTAKSLASGKAVSGHDLIEIEALWKDHARLLRDRLTLAIGEQHTSKTPLMDTTSSKKLGYSKVPSTVIHSAKD